MAITRHEGTRQVSVGGVPVGGGAPIPVQSMTNPPMTTSRDGSVVDVKANLKQIDALVAAGCDIARVAIPNEASVEPFCEIAKESPIPVVADVHFDHLIAIGAARGGAAALRVNPGNINDTDKLDAIIDAAGEAGIPIRIGVNAGSLEPAWRERVDLSLPERLAGSAVEQVEYFRSRGFDDLVVSAKSHDVVTSIEAYRLISEKLPHVPLHLGITEAGTFVQGTVKSAVGIGVLLAEGIGDTIRVSLTDDPVREVEVGWEILSSLSLRRLHAELVSCPTCSRCEVDMIPIARQVGERLKTVRKPIKVAVMGCVVNGPGEAKDADLGVACGPDNGILFASGHSIRKVASDQIVEALFQEIDRLEKQV